MILTSLVEKFNALVPDSIFKDLHSLPIVLNKILRLQEVGARVREGFDDGGFRKRSSRSILYSCLAKSDLDKVINDLQRKVNPSCVAFDETKAELRNLVASMNVDSGAWLKAGYFSISK